MASVDLTVETEIAAAPADIAAVMFDPQREPEWMSVIKSVELIDAALQPGARVRRTASVMGTSLSWVSQVEAVHFPHVLTLSIVEGPFTGRVSYNIQRSPAGSTVRIRNQGETTTFGFVPASMIEPPMRAALVADLERLKALVEKAG